MSTTISPSFCDVPTWRDVVNRNDEIEAALFEVETSEVFLPQVLSDLGFFASNNQVKKNRPDLWREIEDDVTLELAWAHIRIRFIPSGVSTEG